MASPYQFYKNEITQVPYLDNLDQALKEVGYFPVSEEALNSSKEALNSALGGSAAPAIDSLRTAGVVMEQSIPSNPYQNSANAPDSIVTGVTKGTTVGTRGGWAYNATTGEIWPNTSGNGENDW